MLLEIQKLGQVVFGAWANSQVLWITRPIHPRWIFHQGRRDTIGRCAISFGSRISIGQKARETVIFLKRQDESIVSKFRQTHNSIRCASHIFQISSPSRETQRLHNPPSHQRTTSTPTPRLRERPLPSPTSPCSTSSEDVTHIPAPLHSPLLSL